jgi:ABC-type sugar transport system permease subunit
MMVFKYWPMFFTFLLSGLEWNLIRPAKEFVGFGNYIELFQKELFWKSFINTFKYIGIIVPVQIIIPLLIAILLFNISGKKIKSFYQAIIFTPTVLSFAIVCMIWLWMFNPSHGFINHVLNAMGIKGVSWLSEKRTALPALATVTNWKLLGYNILIFFAALSAIPTDYTEAALIDGASSWKIFWNIKLPLLSPTTFFILVTTIIYSSDRVFIPINMLTRGGPYYSTTNLVFAIYRLSFQFFKAGVASSAATITFIIFILITYLQIKYVQRRVHYET